MREFRGLAAVGRRLCWGSQEGRQRSMSWLAAGCFVALLLARWTGGSGGADQAKASNAPPADSKATTIQGGIFQTVSNRKPVSASAKSRGERTALVQTGV